MKKTKKMLSAALAFIIAISSFTLTAFAQSETYMGNYNGNSYYCSASCTSSTCKSSMGTTSTAARSIVNTVSYVKASNNQSATTTLTVSATGTLLTLKGKIPTDVKRFKSLKATFKVGTHTLHTLTEIA